MQCAALFELGNALINMTEQEEACAVPVPDNCPTDFLDVNRTNRTWEPLYFVVLSEEALSSNNVLIPSMGIIALYTTFVIAVARIVRQILVGGAGRAVLEDMPDPRPLLRLVEDIKLAQVEGDMKLEKELYYNLLNIFRDPTLLKEMSKGQC